MEASVTPDAVDVVIMDAGSFYLVYPDLVAVTAGGTVTFRNATDVDADLFLDPEEMGLFRGVKERRTTLTPAGSRPKTLTVGERPGIYKYQVYMTSGPREKPAQFAKAGSRPSIIIVPPTSP